MSAAFRKLEPLRDLAERYGVGTLGEELDDGKTSFGGDVGHRSCVAGIS
jgi:hypothetical protein